MEWWQILLVSVLGGIAALLLSALIVWRMASQRTRALARRIGRLPWSYKLALARQLMTDQRVPPVVRLIPPLLVLYLALPLDLVPDFLPVIGQIDDILVVLVGTALLIRLAPMRVFDEHLAMLEERWEASGEPDLHRLPPRQGETEPLRRG